MLDVLTDNQSLDSALKDGWIILTPNHRMAVQVHESYGAHLKRNSQARVTLSPEIFPIDIWIKTIFHKLALHENDLQLNTVLESYQEIILWKKIIAESELSNPLLKLENAAEKVSEAYRLMTQWQISLQNLDNYKNKIENLSYLDDSTAFIHWLRLYQNYCRKEKLINFSELLSSLIPYIRKHTVNLPEKIILLGFTEPPPLYIELFDTLEQKTQLKRLHWQNMSPVVSKRSFLDDTAEIKAAARWSNEILKTDPAAKIGIISTQLNSQHTFIQTALRTTFSHQNEPDTVFFIDSATNLAKDYPIFLEIPELLKLNQEEIASLELCHILRSPLLLAQSEENARAALEHYLRSNNQTYVRGAYLRELLANDEREWHSPQLAQALQQCENLRRQQNYQQDIQAWADFFSKQLDLLAWPDTETKKQHQFLISCWHQVLESFKKLAFLHASLTFKQAYNLLKPLISNFRYKENRQEAPVQLLSPHDARGLRFTHLWFLGLSDNQWPVSQHPNPFIPIDLQRKVQLPESSAELVHDTAKNILFELYTNTADQIIFSFPRTDLNGELLASPLLSLLDSSTSFSEKPNEEISLQLHPSSLKTFFDTRQAETTELLKEPAFLKIADSEALKGGSRLLSNQADCPFRAFAIHRLNAKEFKEFSYGVPAIDLGTALHLILEQLWEKLKTQDLMHKLSSVQLERIIEDACESGLNFLQKKHKHSYQPAYVKLEKQRLLGLIKKWLEQESLRSAFEVVEKEFKVQWKYASLSLDLKIDRIDKTDNGYALIDYKTGASKVRISTEHRPSDPQLLLYADALAQNKLFKPVNAVLYAQVNVDSLSYHGISLANETFPNTGFSEQKQLTEYSSWEELKQQWQLTLEKLAQEFLDGYIAVDPKGPSSCQYCHLHALCRIQESAQTELFYSYD